MARQKKEDPPPAGAPAWMATYGDLMTLLLCFFVLLFSMSTIDAEKFKSMAESMSQAFSVSVFTSGSPSVGEGVMVSNGVSQLNNLNQYYNTAGQTADDTSDSDQMEADEGKENDEWDGENGGQNDGENDGSNGSAGNNNEQGADGENDGADGSDGNDINVGPNGETDGAEDRWQNVAGAEAYLEQEGLKESESLAEKIEEALKENGMADLVDLDFTAQYVELTLKGALLYDSGSASLKEGILPTIDKIGIILQKYATGTVEIEGHTDNVPIGNSRFASNDELSSARALAVFNYLVDTTSLNPANIKHSGRGEYVPIADNSTPEGRAKNRRVEIRIYNSVYSN